MGRLNHAGYRTRMHCSAALVGPREAVTARHCVEGLEVAELHLLLGFERGRYVEHRRVASVEMAEAGDLARLCLDAEAGVEPLPARAARPDPGPAEVRGYPASTAQVQSRAACALDLVAGQPWAVLDCPSEPGTSGAPVILAQGGGPPSVVGVVSATGEGRTLVALLEALPGSACGPPPG